MVYLRIFGCCVLAVIVAGCYPLSTTRQNMFVQIYKKQTKESLPGAIIHLKKPAPSVNDEDRIDTPPVFCAVSNSEGIAKVRMEEIAYDLWQLKSPDRVTGKEYICKVIYGDHQDVFRITANAGYDGNGEQFSTTVISISPPKYVKTKDGLRWTNPS